MLDASLLFKLASLGIVTLVIGKVMESSGKKDQAFLIELTSTVIGLIVVVGLISKFFDSIKTLFHL